MLLDDAASFMAMKLATEGLVRLRGPRVFPTQKQHVFPAWHTLPLSIKRQTRWITVDAVKGSRERIVILGSGWAGYVFSRDLAHKKFQPLVISPRSYFVFTPLLNEATVGTTEFQSIVEPVRDHRKGVELFQGWADAIDFEKKTIQVEEAIFDPTVTKAMVAGGKGPTTRTKGQTFDLPYDKLVIAVGSYAQTFGTKGVNEHAMFLKDVGDGRKIRKRILELFEVCGLPTFDDDLRKCLLHFAIVGGGPTGMEFAAELRDLINQDLAKLYPQLMKFVRITVFDVAPKVLPMFDESLASYAMQQFGRQGIEIKTSHHVLELRRGLPTGMPTQHGLPPEERKGGAYTITTKEDGEMGIGLCVWSTGNAPNPLLEKAFGQPIKFPSKSAILQGDNELSSASEAPSAVEPGLNTANLKWKVSRHPKIGSLLVTDRFQVQLEAENESPGDSKDAQTPIRAIMRDVYAIGDCATLDSVQLPATAQVANQEAQWLAKVFNNDRLDVEGFEFKDLGVMTYLGGSRALVQGGQGTGQRDGREESPAFNLKGRRAYLLWKGTYLSMTMSWKNRVLVWVYWFITKVFGRDITRF